MPSSSGWKKAFKPALKSTHPYTRPDSTPSTLPAPPPVLPAKPQADPVVVHQKAYQPNNSFSNAQNDSKSSSSSTRLPGKVTNDNSLANSNSYSSSSQASSIGPSLPKSFSKAPTVVEPTVHNEPQTEASSEDSKQLTVQRQRAGMSWNDSTLLEWDPSHFRLFVGNLSGEVTDEMLSRAFSSGNRFPSLQKVKVIRDKKPPFKTKGYGFVSFSDPDDYFRAFKEMNGKYVGNHPIQLRKAVTEIKPVEMQKKIGKKGGHGKNGNGGDIGPAPPPNLAAALVASTKIKTMNLKKSKSKTG